MKSCIRLSLLALPLAVLNAQSGTSDTGGVLNQLTVARFVGSGTQSIQAVATDAAGNVYVAGTTSSPDLPMKNAAQPAIGEALLMRSLDTGATWRKVPNPPDLPLIVAPHPRDSQTIFVGSGSGIFKTADGGQTWRRVYAWSSTFTASGQCCFNFAIDPADTRRMYVFVFGSVVQFLASGDGGESWQPRAAPLPYVTQNPRELWVDPNGSGIVGLGPWLSSDRGVNWTTMAPVPTWILTFTVPDPRHAGWIYAATSAGTSGSLYLSKDWGTTWAERPSPVRSGDPEPVAVVDLLFDPDLPNVLYAPDIFGSVNVSDDDGASWHAPGDIVLFESDHSSVLLSRQCAGGGGPVSTARLTRVLDIAAGTGCAVFAARSMASDAFVAKLAPGGSEVMWSTFLGGSDLDTSAALALDDRGNVYVAGNTASADFPTTAPRIGSQGQQNVFVVKLDADGKLIYSVVYGGELRDAATGLAVNANGEAHLVGWTGSESFPTSPGAFQTQAGVTGDGFAIKLDRGGNTVYVSYLPGFVTYFSSNKVISPPWVVAVAAEASGSALVGGYAGMLARITPDGSSLTQLSRQPGQIFTMETDGQGNIYVAGQEPGTGTSSGTCYVGYYYDYVISAPPGDIFLTKLQPDSLQPVFSARLFGPCQSWPGTVRIGPTGEVTIGLWTFGSFPMRNPVLPVLPCSGAAVVSRLSADGSVLLFSTYLDMCDGQAPPVALAPDGSVYAGVGPGASAGVLRIPVAQPGGMSVQGVVNALSGAPGLAAPGMLLTITGQDLAPAFLDLGLNDPNPLPTQLGGVQVLFDGTPAEMFQVAGDHLICVVPAGVKGQKSVGVQVVSGPRKSTPFVLPTSFNNFGLLTHSFPNLPPAGSVDGNIRNADGTLNDAEHPAAPGSTVTLFATGLTGPGDIALLWNAPPPQRYELVHPLYGTARHMLGFVDALYAIDFRIPDSPGEGVYLVPVPGVLTRAEIGRVGSGIGVYVK